MAMANPDGIIITVELEDGTTEKRRLFDNEELKEWLTDLQTDVLLEPDAYDVGVKRIELLKENVVYRPRIRKKRSTPEDEVSLVELIQSQQFEEGWTQFVNGCKYYQGLGEDDELSMVCYPKKLPRTWKGETFVRDLRAKCEEVKNNIKLNNDNRAGRVIGLRLGSGCGKSHFLLEAPTFLQYGALYITYNLGQGLTIDLREPENAILLRILLRSAKVPNGNCPRFLHSKMGVLLLGMDEEHLLQFVLYRLKTLKGPIFIGVDEIMDLKIIPVIQSILSTLGDLATKCYHQNDLQECFIVVSSLNKAPFNTSSGRPVIRFKSESLTPNESAVDHVLGFYNLGRDQARQARMKVLALSAAGFHFRSLVFAAEAMSTGRTPSVESVLFDVGTRWSQKIGTDPFDAMKKYVLALCQGITPEKDDLVEQYLDLEKALPPALICLVFNVIDHEKQTVDTKNPLFGLFNCELAFTSPAKHLEQFGLYYDLFRQQERLSVFSNNVKVVIPLVDGIPCSKKGDEWFKKLRYPTELNRDDTPLFAVDKQKSVVLTKEGESPRAGKYYAPAPVNHPLIDRTFIAFNNEGEGECFVLIQDKVNKDFPKAINDLNEAAKLIKNRNVDAEILCIVNVIGASSMTTSQAKLRYPHVLVRNSELNDFYSVNFARVARFARQRHLLEQEPL